MGKRKYVWGALALIVVVGIFLSVSPKGSSFPAVDGFEKDIQIFKSSSCGCCGIYADYFQRKGNSGAKVVNLPSIDSIKENYGVPSALQSCHTAIVGDYFVEGHIPLEAVEKLLTEKPDIKGIAMSGMPSGSPGMPGTKSGDFVVYAVNHDGSFGEWMRI